MSKRPIERRPHGPINQAFTRMWWDEAAEKVHFDAIDPEDVYIEIIPPGPYVDPHQRGAIA